MAIENKSTPAGTPEAPAPEQATGTPEAPAPEQATGTPEAPAPEQAAALSTSKSQKLLVITFVVLVILLAVVVWAVFAYLGKGSGARDETGMTWIRSIYGFGNTYEELTSPTGAAVDVGGASFWITDPGRQRLVHYGVNGQYKGQIYHKPNTAGALRQPADVAMDSDGLLYVVEPTYNVVRVYTADGKEKGSFEVPGAQSIAVNNDYIVVGSNNGIAICDKQGNLQKLVGINGKGAQQFDKVNGIALDDDNNIYVVDSFNNRISKYNERGNRVWETIAGYPGNAQMTGKKEFESTAKAQLQVPMGATLDANGHLCVVDMFDFCIARFDTQTGKFVDKFGVLGTNDGELWYPSDIDYFPELDQFVVSDTGASRAQVFELPDSGGSLLSRLRSALTGPLALCCIPLLILLVTGTVAFLLSRRHRMQEHARLEASAQEAAKTERDIAKN